MHPNTLDTTITIRLDTSQRRAIDAAAGRDRRGLSKVVRRALIAGLAVIADDTDRDPPPPAAPAARDLPLPVAA